MVDSILSVSTEIIDYEGGIVKGEIVIFSIMDAGGPRRPATTEGRAVTMASSDRPSTKGAFMRHFILSIALLWVLASSLTARAQGKDQAEKPAKGKAAVPLIGVDAVRYFVRNGNYIEAEDYAYPIIWKDLNQPELLHLLAQSLSKLNRREDAATYYRLLMRLHEESPSADSAKFKPLAEKFLTFGETDHLKRVKQYEAETGGKFTTPAAVSDLWMTQVTADLYTLDELLAWKLARVDVEFADNEPQSVHRKQGVMHRSGMKRVDEVEGRKGVLFTLPHTRPAKGTVAALDGPPIKGATRVTLPYGGKGGFLRVGVKGYLSAFTLEVSIKGTVLHTQKVDANTWSDLKIELKEPLKAKELVTLELIAGQSKWPNEGVWLDYVGFFAD
jgi:hypothetical protein